MHSPSLLAYRLALPFAASLALMAGCGGHVSIESNGSSGGASSSSSGGTSSSSSSGSSSGAPQCGQTHDVLAIQIVDPNGQTYDCNGMPSNPGQLIEFTGELISQTTGTLVIETCPPTADCPSIPYTISLKAQGLSLPTMPKGVYMKVSAQFQQGWACVSQLLIQNAPSWAGVPNPNSQDEFVWFAGADGTTDVLPGSPFVIEPQALGCYPDAPPDCGPKDDYQLLFTSLAIPGYTKAVSMGNTIEWALKDPNGRFLLIRNLRSYSSGFCDDYWNWAYWMSFPPTVD